jgi:hypothetical protein
MTPVDRLLEQYAAAYQSGKPDPVPFLRQVDGSERVELERLIELFLGNVEPAEWDPAAFEGSRAAELAEQLVPVLLEPEGGWCDLLPSLRLENEIKREKVTAELAEALDAQGGEEREKVADYYHYMEQGRLDPEGVSERVLEALSGIYDTTVKVLRRAGEATTGQASPGAIYARSIDEGIETDSAVSASRMVPRDRTPMRIKGKPDRIDRLFVDVDRLESSR